MINGVFLHIINTCMTNIIHFGSDRCHLTCNESEEPTGRLLEPQSTAFQSDRSSSTRKRLPKRSRSRTSLACLASINRIARLGWRLRVNELCTRNECVVCYIFPTLLASSSALKLIIVRARRRFSCPIGGSDCARECVLPLNCCDRIASALNSQRRPHTDACVSAPQNGGANLSEGIIYRARCTQSQSHDGLRQFAAGAGVKHYIISVIIGGGRNSKRSARVCCFLFSQRKQIQIVSELNDDFD